MNVRGGLNLAMIRSCWRSHDKVIPLPPVACFVARHVVCSERENSEETNQIETGRELSFGVGERENVQKLRKGHALT